jgi:hypothetical protein
MILYSFTLSDPKSLFNTANRKTTSLTSTNLTTANLTTNHIPRSRGSRDKQGRMVDQ